MIDKLLVVAAALTAINGNAVAPATRNGMSNQYYLFKRDHGNGMLPIEMPQDANEPSVIPDQLNPLMNTIVIVHGHNGGLGSLLNSVIIGAFFDNSRASNDDNIIVVDWSSYAGQNYYSATAAVALVGEELGEYLEVLEARNFIVFDQLHLIGFNLGAHVVGYAGRALNGQAARITGLDPSGKYWGTNSGRLSIADAQYVEVIHTDGDGLLGNGIGTAIGNADFFVNGGNNQPGCLTHSCSHDRAWELFAATLTRVPQLVGNLCTSNLQLSLNRCSSRSLNIGGDDLFKRPAIFDGTNIYRVNTGRRYPY